MSHQPSEHQTYVGTLILFRHGSRAPSKPAFDMFSKHPKIKQQWTLPDGSSNVDNLLPTGMEQAQQLGAWSRNYLQEMNPNLENPSTQHVRWHSSKIERAKDSGEAFWKGFFADTQVTIQPQPFEGDPDAVFRPWWTHEEYRKWADSSRSSQEFAEKAKSEKQTIDDILEKLSMSALTSKIPYSSLLYGMTMVQELLDCEKYFPEANPGPVNEMLADYEKQVQDLAVWSWDQRFFKHPFVKALGTQLLQTIHQEFRIIADRSNDSCLTVFSGHDYTVLVLLASLGIPDYPQFLSFCSYLLFDLYEQTNTDGKNEIVFRVSLNPDPFEQDAVPQTTVQSANIQYLLNSTQSTFWSLSETETLL